jgi:hypothetical protein
MVCGDDTVVLELLHPVQLLQSLGILLDPQVTHLVVAAAADPAGYRVVAAGVPLACYALLAPA